MAAPTLSRSLVGLRGEINALAENRDKSSDGWIGDTAHSSRVSDHNPDEREIVHAIDVDEDLREPGLTMERIVQYILTRCRSGAENRLKYIIYERRIWSESQGWRERPYSGVNAHDKHAHFSGKYGVKFENDTRSWKLEDIEVALTAADKNWIKTQIDEGAERAATAAAQKVWATRLDVNIDPKGKASLQPAGSILRYLSPEGHKTRDLLNTVINLLKGGTK